MFRAISASQCRAARGLLNWTREDLAKASGVPVRTIADLELETTQPRAATMAKIVAAIESAGAALVPENGGGIGVRFKTP